MVPSYHMVVVNLIFSAALLATVIFYRFVYPKRKLNMLTLLVLISILPVVSIFRYGSYQSGDLNYHVMRTMSYYDVLAIEHSFPRWTWDFYGGFGDPYAMFAYPLAYLLGSLIHVLGFSFLNSVKIIFASAFIVSGITMYFWARDELKNKTFAFVASIFYLFSPYHLVDMHFRATIAESLSFVFPPLLLFLTKRLIETNKPKYFILQSISVGALILCHQVTALVFIPILIFYAFFVFFRKDERNFFKILWFFLSIIFGLWISFFYWFPVMIESRYIQPATVFFASFWQIIYSPWMYGFLFQGHRGELSLIVGYTQLLVVFISLILIFRKTITKEIRSLLLFSLLMFFLLIFMIYPVSKPLWFILPFVKNFQFSIRLLVIVAVFTSIIAGITVKVINKNWFTTVLVLLTIFYTILNWGNRTMINIDDKILRGMMLTPPKVHGVEASSPTWVDPAKMFLNAKRLEIISGNATFFEIKRTPYHHIYTVTTLTDSSFMEKTIYFPGWVLRVNEKNELINYRNKNFPGIVTFNLKKGKYKVELDYTDTPDRSASWNISLFAWLLLFLYLVFYVNEFLKKQSN